MEKKKYITFPKAWSQFVIEQKLEWLEEYTQNFYVQIPLLYDVAHLQKLNSLQPWDKPEEYIPKLFAEWSRVKEELYEKFTNRKQPIVEEWMKKGIGLFLEALYWSNGAPVDVKSVRVDKLKIQPVNLQERLDFIFTYPNKYHSYVQLSELFVEIEKLFIKQQVMNKMK